MLYSNNIGDMNKIRSKYYLLLVLVVGYAFSYTNNETGWEYEQTTQQAFYIFESISIDLFLGMI